MKKRNRWRRVGGLLIVTGGKIPYLEGVMGFKAERQMAGGPEMSMSLGGFGDDRADAYRSALIHSRRVRRLKTLLPVIAVVISLAFIAVSWIRTMIPENLSILGAKIENGMIVMERPAISGRNFDGISYYMNASRALQSIRNPYEITFEDIDAALPVNGEVMARFAARTAMFDRGKDRLDLSEPFSIELSSGITASFQSAKIDVPKGTLTTPDKVSIKAREATIVADSLEITDKGRKIVMTGHVRVTVNPATIRQQPQVNTP